MTKGNDTTGKPTTDAVAGFECRSCGCRHFHVVYTRPTERGVTRVRACRHCGRRIVTRETLLGEPSRGQYHG
jgi:DNA-directed RNA polymerase subunit M/transcription elongation factor TFIIS